MKPAAGLQRINGYCHHSTSRDMDESQLGIMIPIIAITLGLTIPIVKSVMDYKRKRALIEAMKQERIAAIEKGVTPPDWPDHMIREKGDQAAPTSTTELEHARHGQLTGGLITLFVGVAVLFGLPPLIGESTARAGLIPIGIGLAMLLAWALRGRGGGSGSGDGPNNTGRP
jgi:hypothetical protein